MFTFNLNSKYYCAVGLRRVPNRLFLFVKRVDNKETVRSFALNGTETAHAATHSEWKFTHEYQGSQKTLSSDGKVVKLGNVKICSTPTFSMLCRIAIAEFMRPAWRPRVTLSDDDTPNEDVEEDNEENEQPF